MLARAELAGQVAADQRGVVDEQVGDAEAVDDRVERGAERRLVGDVGADAVGLGVLGADRGLGGGDRGGRAGDEADAEALAGDAAGDGGADAGAGADDDG